MFILGQHNVCEFGHLRMWPERGLIHIEDSRDGSYEVISVVSCLHRMQAHSDMLGNSRNQFRGDSAIGVDDYDRIQKMLERMIDVVEAAKVQGMPTDESARRDLVRRRPETVVMPSSGYMM